MRTTVKHTLVLLLWLLIGSPSPILAQQSDDLPKDVEAYLEEVKKIANQDKPEEALELLGKATELAEEKENIKQLVDCYHALAEVYLRTGKTDTALFYWNRAKILLEDLAYPHGNAQHKYINAKTLIGENKNYMALYLIGEAKKLSNDRNLLNNMMLTEGQIYTNIGKYDTASKNYNFLTINSDPIEMDYLAAQAFMGLAKTEMLQDHPEAASIHALKALDLAQKNGFTALQMDANRFLGDTYKTLGAYEESLIYNQNLLNLLDSLSGKEMAAPITQGGTDNVHYDFLKREVKRQDELIEELNEYVNRSELTAILASAFLTIISLLAVSLYRNNQIKLKTNALLKSKNDELALARDKAVLAMEAKTNFLSTVSHELRTPLYAVTGLTNLLLEEAPKQGQLEHLKALKFSGDYLLNFINDILQINKIDADKVEMLHVAFSLKKMMEEVINSMQQHAKSNNTSLTLEYDNKIPSLLLGDPIKLSQVIMNLVGNALKFTKEGEVILLAQLLDKTDDEVTLYIEIRDTGIGVSEEMQENIFDSFEQGSVQINREYGGSGLGLTIVKSLLGLFNTKIQLESQLGKGSSFFFELKLEAQTAHNLPAEDIAKMEYDLSGLHILIVEDNKINQVITKKMLAKKEVTTDIANNGIEAVALCKENEYHAILMDIHMPEMGGEEATAEIRKFNKEIPIIALTAISLDDSVEHFFEVGCNDVITKPFKPENFYQTIGKNIFLPKRASHSV